MPEIPAPTTSTSKCSRISRGGLSRNARGTPPRGRVGSHSRPPRAKWNAGVFAEVLSAAAAAPPPFVGREREEAALAEALAQAWAGRGNVVFVSGEAGIGKTRLAEEFAARARAAHARVLWGRPWHGAAAPFWPWMEALRERVDGEEADVLGARGTDLVRLVPELGASLPPAPGPLDLDGERARFLLFDSVTALLAAATARTPTVL